MKRCSKGDQCVHPESKGGWLPVTNEYFHRDKSKRDGLASTCKACRKVKKREWYTANAENAREYSRNWARANYDAVLAKNRAWRKHNRAKADGYNEHWKVSNRAKYLSGRHRRYQLNAQQNREAAKEWRRQNPDKLKLQWRVRQARERSAEGNHTPSDIRAMFESQEGRCAYCGIKLDARFHVDHIIPVSRGGSNDPENLCLACRDCNLSKKDKTPDEWKAIRGW